MRRLTSRCRGAAANTAVALAIATMTTAGVGAALGCGGRGGAAKTAAAPGAAVPAGTRFAVRLDEPLSLRAASGTTVTATVVAPIAAGSGAIVVPEGATLRGHVVDVRLEEGASGVRPRLRLAFDSIETTYGPAPVSARVLDPGPDALVAPLPPAEGAATVIEKLQGGTAGAIAGEAGEAGESPGGWTSSSPIGGGPLPFGEPPTRQDVLIAEDARIELTLTAPLVSPRR